MNRRQERVLLAVLGLILAGLTVAAGARTLGSGDDEPDLAAGGEAASVVPDDGDGGEPDPTELLPQDGTDPSSVPSTTVQSIDSADSSTTSIATTTSTPPTTVPSSTAATNPSSSTSSTTTEKTTTTAAQTTSTVDESSTTVVDDGGDTTTTTTTTSEPTGGGETTSTTEAESTTTTTEETTTTVPDSGLSALEQEIIRLTNALRGDPSGTLRRKAPLPECVADEFYGITVDPETGHPTPVPGLSENRDLSVQMARDWSQQMAEADAMTHRSRDSQRAIYSALGIEWTSFGENVAWAQGYVESSIAQQFFSGWRESDTGHYCSMMSGRFTHIGVGHHRTSAGKDWGTQNFYSAR